MPPARRPLLAPLRRFAIRFINPVTRLVAGWLPNFGILTYRGRKSGRVYQTPMNVFRHGGEFVFALTYGPDVQWVKNVLASGELDLRSVGRDYHLTDPVLFTDPAAREVPAIVRFFLRSMHVEAFLRMRIASPSTTGGNSAKFQSGTA
jgi:deazaflavin-dependent oxidoreductase (nitroreductase family)